MLDKNGLFKCDFCGSQLGIFDTQTGNHTNCQYKTELAALKARLAEAEEVIRPFVNLTPISMTISAMTNGKISIAEIYRAAGWLRAGRL